MNAKQGMRVALLAATAMLAAASQGAAADEKQLAYGRHLSQECTSCHSRDGLDKGIPSITGLDVEYFTSTMRFYQNGSRTNPAMVSVAQSLDDDQLKALAAFFTSLPTQKAAAPALQKK